VLRKRGIRFAPALGANQHDGYLDRLRRQVQVALRSPRAPDEMILPSSQTGWQDHFASLGAPQT